MPDLLSNSDGKKSACNTGDLGLIPGSGRSSGRGNGKPLQYSCLENSMDRGAWQVTVCGVAKSRTLFTSSILTNITNVKKKSLVVEMRDNPTAICLMEKALEEFDVF